MSNQHKDFKRLQRHWYKKLEREGFEDAEQEDGALKVWALSGWRSRLDPVRNSAVADYYRLAGHFLHDHKFESRFDKKVWELHAEGVSSRNIVIKLKSQGLTAYRDNVDEAIRRLASLMVKRANKE